MYLWKAIVTESLVMAFKAWCFELILRDAALADFISSQKRTFTTIYGFIAKAAYFPSLSKKPMYLWKAIVTESQVIAFKAWCFELILYYEMQRWFDLQ